MDTWTLRSCCALALPCQVSLDSRPLRVSSFGFNFQLFPTPTFPTPPLQFLSIDICGFRLIHTASPPTLSLLPSPFSLSHPLTLSISVFCSCPHSVFDPLPRTDPEPVSYIILKPFRSRAACEGPEKPLGTVLYLPRCSNAPSCCSE